MSPERLMNVLLAPRISEKSTLLAENHRQITFKVASDANKQEIKQAVESLFNVAVKAVTVCNVKGKTRRFGQITGRRKGWKKAYVTLHEGHDIDFTTAE